MVVLVIALVFKINGTSNITEVVRGKAEYYNLFTSVIDHTYYGCPCYHWLIVYRHLYVKALAIYHPLLETSQQHLQHNYG